MNCRTCKFNSYIDTDIKDFIDCCHPVTFDRGPRWQKGDPAMVNYRTGDVHISQIHNLTDCPTYEVHTAASVTPKDRSGGEA